MPNIDFEWIKSYPQGVESDVDTHPFESINDLFEYACEKYADHIAYTNMSKSLTYGQLKNKVELFCSFLQNHLRLKKGDKLALMMPNVLQYPVCLFAALKAGLTVININPLYTPRELTAILPDSNAKAIVVLENFAHVLYQVIDKTQIEHVVIAKVGDCLGFKGSIINLILKLKGFKYYRFKNAISFKKALYLGSLLPYKEVASRYNELAFLQYTGGTTGKPKAAMLSHGNIIANITQAYSFYSPVLKRGQEKVLTAIPVYHVFAMTINLVLMMAIGAHNLLITDPRNIRRFIATLKKHNDISLMTGVNTLFNALLQHKAFDEIKFKKLKLVIGGGAAIQSGVAHLFYQKTGLNILEGYGLTECSPLVCVCPYTTKQYTGTIGLPVPATQVAIIDENGNFIHELDVKGELVVKGPQVMQGYYKNEQATAHTIVNGFCRTGDIAVWKEGGYIKIIERIKDMILVSGFNVFPSEIEDVVSKFTGVLECAVIGIPSENTGEAVCLYIVRKKGSNFTKDDLIEYCKANLTGYKIPKEIRFLNSLPKNTIGKVLRRELREEYKKHLNEKSKHTLH